MIFQTESNGHALDRALEVQLSCAFQKPLITACSNHSGLVAVYGIDSEGRACFLIVSLASPSSQVWVRLPKALETSPVDAIEWSPIGVEEMLLFKCTDRVGVLSMSSRDRSVQVQLRCRALAMPAFAIKSHDIHACSRSVLHEHRHTTVTRRCRCPGAISTVCRGDPHSVNWRFFNTWHFHEVCTAAPGIPIASAQWLQPPPSLRWPTVLDQHPYANSNPHSSSSSYHAPFSSLATSAEPFTADEQLTLTTQDTGAAESGQRPPRQEWVRSADKLHCPHLPQRHYASPDTTPSMHAGHTSRS